MTDFFILLLCFVLQIFEQKYKKNKQKGTRKKDNVKKKLKLDVKLINYFYIIF